MVYGSWRGIWSKSFYLWRNLYRSDPFLLAFNRLACTQLPQRKINRASGNVCDVLFYFGIHLFNNRRAQRALVGLRCCRFASCIRSVFSDQEGTAGDRGRNGET